MTTLTLHPGQVVTRAELTSSGLDSRDITRAVREGDLIRIRRDRYMQASPGGIDRAVRVGGRLACVSLLALLGVFVLDSSRLHVHLEATMSRLRSPDRSDRALSPAARARLRLHWWPLKHEGATLGVVGVADALAQAVRCQSVRCAVATVDSILHLGILSWHDVYEVFAGLPRKYRVILDVADGIAESGSETFMRLLLRQLGVRYETQVSIPGVGRVDFVVDGWLIIECDSKAHHEGWEKQREDRRRDLAAAALGFTTLRPLAEDLFSHTDIVLAAVRGLLAARRAAARR